MINIIHTISWKLIKSGQLSPYKDSIYIYKIFSDLPIKDIKIFCTTFLYSCENQCNGGKFNGSCGFPFGLDSFYAFEKISDNQYRYSVCRPFTG